MKMFTKLVLVSSMAISANAMALTSMDDAALSAATGQDGISIGIGLSKIEIQKLFIHDNDGLATAGVAGEAGFGGTGLAGAISIKGNGVSGDVNELNGIVISAPVNATNDGYDPTRMLTTGHLADLVIDSDAGTAATGGAFLNVAAQVSGLDIAIGEIGVTASNTPTAALRRGGDDTTYNAILSGLTLKTGVMNANIQIGAAPQGAMIMLESKMIGGLEIANLGILDNSTTQGLGDGTVGNRAAGEIFVESIKIADANGSDLTVNAAVSVYGKEGTNNGYLQIITGSGATTPATDMYVKGVHLGSSAAASIGDIEVQGLQTYYNPTGAFGNNVAGAAITISGH